MTTWRDRASALAQDDLDRLLDFALNEGAELLAEQGEFAPFAAVVSSDGELSPFATFSGAEGQNSSAVRESLFAALRGMREGLRAAAVATDVRVASGDAIDFHLEHAEGTTMLVRAPYRLTDDSLQVDERSAYSEPSRIWSA